MYKIAASTIEAGLSRGARWLLGIVSALFGVMMIAIAPGSSSPSGFVVFGGFCLAIALACATKGRVRQFIGSVIASAILCSCVWYAWSEVGTGRLISSRRSEPSLLNAMLFCVFFGLPSVRYLFSARFGFAKKD